MPSLGLSQKWVEERQVELGLNDPSSGGQAQAARPPDMDPPPGNAD